MKSILWVSDKANENKRHSPSSADVAKHLPTDSALSLQQRLLQAGYRVKTTTPEYLEKNLRGMEAIVWAIPAIHLDHYQQHLSAGGKIPQLWRCDGSDPDQQNVEHLEHLDGILYDEMDERQLRWSLQISILHHQHRSGYQQLKRKLDERKWIDQAKWILCNAKGLSEEEAYQMIRRQAMDDRKSMATVSQEIIRVHRLLHTRPRGD